MGEKISTGGKKEFFYSKEDIKKIESEDTFSTMEFKKAYKDWKKNEEVRGFKLQKEKKGEEKRKLKRKKGKIKKKTKKRKYKRKKENEKNLNVSFKYLIKRIQKFIKNNPKSFKIIILSILIFLILAFYPVEKDIIEKNATFVECYSDNDCLSNPANEIPTGNFGGVIKCKFCMENKCLQYPGESYGEEKECLDKKNSSLKLFYLDTNISLQSTVLKEIFEFLRPKIKDCFDDTSFNTCSINKPYFCKNEKFIEKPKKCGCPYGERLYGNECIKIMECSDGTLHPECSNNKPLQCMNGTLVNKATFCGCPIGYNQNGEGCIKIQRCSDNTIYGDCSNDKPLFCDEGVLINKATFCGCPPNGEMKGNECIKINTIKIKELVQNPEAYVDEIVEIKGKLIQRMGGYSLKDNEDYWVWIGEDSWGKDCIERYREYTDYQTYEAKGIWKSGIAGFGRIEYRLHCDSYIN